MLLLTACCMLHLAQALHAISQHTCMRDVQGLSIGLFGMMTNFLNTTAFAFKEIKAHIGHLVLLPCCIEGYKPCMQHPLRYLP